MLLSNTNIPHSCGEMCGRPKSKATECKHPCVAICHPGSCQSCRLPSNIERHCACGKMSYKLLCGQSEEKPKLCNDDCRKLLNCKKHFCQKKCHHGKCDPCTVTVKATCFCGKFSFIFGLFCLYAYVSFLLFEKRKNVNVVLFGFVWVFFKQ